MSFIGLRKPIIAQLNADGTTYKTPTITFGKAVKFNVDPNYAEAESYADDALDEYEKSFIDADLTLGTNRIPIEAQNPMFGHTVDTEKKGITFNKDDSSNYVGLATIQTEVISGVKTYNAMFLPKCKFTEPSDEFETKGKDITYKTPEIKGKAVAPDADGNWKYVEKFDTEALALAWVNTKFGVTAGS